MQIDYGVTFLFLGLIIASYYYLKDKKKKKQLKLGKIILKMS